MKCPVLSCIGLLLLLLVVGVTVGVTDSYTWIYATSADVNQGATVHGSHLSDIETGDYVGYKQLNFSAETVAIEWRFANTADYDSSHKVSLRLDSPTAQPFLNHHIQPTSDWYILSTAWIAVDQRPRGVHDLYFTFQYSGGLKFYWFRFVSLKSLLPPSTTLCPIATATDSPTPPPTTCSPSGTTCPPPVTCPPPIYCPPPVTCPLSESSVHPSEPRSHVSVEQCDNDTLTHNHINIYIN